MTYLVRTNVALGPLTTLKTGGTASYYQEITTVSELEKAVVYAHEAQLPFCVLGGGSNMLVSDEGYKGMVLHMKLLGRTYSEVTNDMCTLTVSAGEVFDEVIKDTVDKGLWGLENLSHIPGTVGATPVQNVGAYGVEVSDCIMHVTVFDTDTNKIFDLQKSECSFAYRHSIFKEKNNFVIVSVTFALSVKSNPKISYADIAARVSATATPVMIREAIISIRSEKFPDWNNVGTAGSFFKNPIITAGEAQSLLAKYPDIPTYLAADGMVKVSLGYILDKLCGLKGFAVGPVRLYEKQALVLVAERGATTTDIKNFKNIISEKVFQKTFIKIFQEVTEI